MAVAHGLEVELDERLGEHTEGDPWDELLAGIATDTVICTHGPQLKRLGGRVPGQIPGSPWLDLPVASGWRLRVIAGVVTEGQRIEPPDLVPTGATERPGIPGSVPNPATKT